MIYTSYYAKKLPEHIDRISISIGFPRWEKNILRLLEFAPRPEWLMIKGEQEYRKHYIQHLDNMGIDVIIEILDSASCDGLKDIALLCYESLNREKNPEQFCHRRMLAEYIEKHAGLEVPEYA